MRIRITASGIYGADGEVPVGTEFEIKNEPTGWAGRYMVLAKTKGKKAVTNENPSETPDDPEDEGGAPEASESPGKQSPKAPDAEKSGEAAKPWG